MESKDLAAPTFDLELWADNYEGALLPLRLAHFAIHYPPLARHALFLALSAAKRGKDVQLYGRLHEAAGGLGLSDLAKPDAEWTARQTEANRRELSRLEGELRGYKNNLIRESIRMGQEDLAMHLFLTGGPSRDRSNPRSTSSNTGYNAAFQAFSKMRDYCTTPTHMAGMHIRLIYTGLVQAVSAQQTGSSPVMHYNSVIANASRLQGVGVKDEEQARLMPVMHAVYGISHLSLGAYRQAAENFLATPHDYIRNGSLHGIDFTKAVASGNDIAIYGGLCALATMTRDELTTLVLGGSFRSFLEMEPHMRKAISLYITAKYQACISILQHHYTDWSLDVFLGAPSGPNSGVPHVDRLLAGIREKGIQAYLSSFSEISLASLAETFPPHPSTNADSASPASPSSAMQQEILSMIEMGALDARLDLADGVVVSERGNLRNGAHASAVHVGQEVERSLLYHLHRANVAMAGLEITKPKGAMAGMGPMGRGPMGQRAPRGGGGDGKKAPPAYAMER